ncbi:MAG: hypothetical protein AAGJ85_02640 [Pseudomonadota bacterium]
MTPFKTLFITCLSASLLIACGEENSPDATLQTPDASAGKLNAYAKALVREEGCDPDIARAMAPYESDYGECRMPQFLDTCGAQNKSDGIQLISEIRDEGTEGLNPWLRACVRSQDVQTSLNALCQARMRQTDEVCSCVAEGTIRGIDDAELTQWFTIAHAYDPNWQKGQYETWGSMMSEENRFDDLESAKAVFYNQLKTCGT